MSTLSPLVILCPPIPKANGLSFILLFHPVSACVILCRSLLIKSCFFLCHPVSSSIIKYRPLLKKKMPYPSSSCVILYSKRVAFSFVILYSWKNILFMSNSISSCVILWPILLIERYFFLFHPMSSYAFLYSKEVDSFVVILYHPTITRLHKINSYSVWL